jgi:nucleoside-triphosphatase THEP1
LKEIRYKPLNSVWLKAAVIGSVWASVEIVLGSFLHNLRVPMSGTFLSFISVYLLIAYHQLWNQKGLIIRAGLICALMKSISPSAIIIGPMTGILSEALLLELMVSFLGSNRLAYFLGGGLAVFSTLAHKAISLLIYYGFNFVEMLAKMYTFSTRQMQMVHIANPLTALVILTIFYFGVGVFAAWLGQLAGKQSVQRNPNAVPMAITFDGGRMFDSGGHIRIFKPLLFIVLHMASIILTLSFLNKEMFAWSFALGVVYLLVCFVFYKNSLRRLRKISIWFQFVLVTFFAVLVWNVLNHQGLFSSVGILIGITMVFRAMLIMIGFSAIGAELKNPSVKLILYGKGFKNLYHAVDLAFSALPFLISQLSENNKTVRGYLSVGIRFLESSKQLLDSFSLKNEKKATVCIITGEVHQGKTTFTSNLVNHFKANGHLVSGFLTQRQPTTDGSTAYQLLDINANQSIDFIDTQKHEGWMPFRRFNFNPDGFIAGNSLLSARLTNKAKVVFIDEIGPMELSNKGWSLAIEQLCLHPEVIQIWVVRKHLLKAIQLKWDIGDVIIADIEKDSVLQVYEKINSLLSV